MQPSSGVQNRGRGFELPRAGFLVVKLNARSTLIESTDREDKGDKFVVHSYHAIPLEVYQELHRWRARTWKRLKKFKVLDWMGVSLYSVKDYDAIKQLLDEARREYEEIVNKIPDEEVREKFCCDPQILVVSAPPAYEESFKRDVSEGMLSQLLERVEEVLKKHENKDPELKAKLERVEGMMEALIKKLRDVEGKAVEVEKLVNLLHVNDSLKQLVAQLTTLRALSRVDRRVIKGVEEAVKKLEKAEEVLTPEAKKLLELAKQHLEAIKAGQVGDLNAAVAELERALLGGESR